MTATFVAFFDGSRPDVDAKAGLLEDGEAYRSMLTDAVADPQFRAMTAQVRDVQPLDDEGCRAANVTAPCAAVDFDLLVSGFPALAAHRGYAVDVGGAWKVAASVWCDVVAIGGASCG